MSNWGDASGNVTSSDDYAGVRTCYAYDAANREVTRVVGLANTVLCTAVLPASSTLHGDGQDGAIWATDSSASQQTLTFAGDGRISTAQSKFGGAPISFDGSGDYITIENPTDLNFGSGDFTIDADLLSGVAQPDGTTLSYLYDAAGNRTAKTVNGTTYTNTVAATRNRYAQTQDVTGTATVVHDAAGNVTADGANAYAYGDRGRMNGANNPSASLSFTNNGLELRASKTTGAGSTYYVYDEAGQLLGEYDTNGNAVYETIYLGNTPVGVIKQGSTYNLHADQIDTPRLITKQDHTIVWRWDTAEAFGASAPNQDPNAFGVFLFDQRFPGQVFDVETGLNQNINREYDPRTGRYRQFDPTGLDDGPNGYLYVGGNPLSFVDPLGLKKVILLPPTDPNYAAAMSTPDDPNTCLVISHGSPQSVGGMNAKQLNKFLNKAGCKKEPVKLDACRTGQGENSIAEQLAKTRKTIVIAPDERTWTTPWNSNLDTPYPPMSLDKNSFWNSIPDITKPGTWRQFGP